MNTPDEALIGPNPRDEIIKEIARIKEKQAANHRVELVQWEKNSFGWATGELARRYFGLSSLDSFDTKKLASLQNLIYEKARKAYIRHTAMLALTPLIGWTLLFIRWLDRDCGYCWPTHKFVKFYKKFKKKEESRKAGE